MILKVYFSTKYRKRLHLRECFFFHACTYLLFEVHALKKYALIRKRLRYDKK